MVKRIVFHLGGPKTGSTSIQHTLAAKAWKCSDVSVAYTTKLNHIPLAKSLLKKNSAESTNKFWSRQAKRIRNADADIAIISAEAFERIDPAALKAALEKYLPEYVESARFIAYTRPHADRLISAYAERLKQGGFSGSLQELHQYTKKNKSFFFYDKFYSWREVFGDRYELRPMIRSELYQNCVVRDFLNFVFEGADFQLTKEPASNTSLSLEDLAMLRDFHQGLLVNGRPTRNQRALGWAFSDLLTAAPREKQTKLAIQRALIPKIVETYKEDAQKIDETFFEGTPLSDALMAAESKAINKPQSILPEDYFTPDELRVYRAWGALVIKISAVNPSGLPAHFRKIRFAELGKTKVN